MSTLRFLSELCIHVSEVLTHCEVTEISTNSIETQMHYVWASKSCPHRHSFLFLDFRRQPEGRE